MFVVHFGSKAPATSVPLCLDALTCGAAAAAAAQVREEDEDLADAIRLSLHGGAQGAGSPQVSRLDSGAAANEEGEEEQDEEEDEDLAEAIRLSLGAQVAGEASSPQVLEPNSNSGAVLAGPEEDDDLAEAIRLSQDAGAQGQGEASSNPAGANLCRGSLVRVVALQARPELNGTLGRLLDFDEEKQRWQVLLNDGSKLSLPLGAKIH